jgi:nucleotide-binding universal stress UspA family protein
VSGANSPGPVVFAFDGSELAKLAIEEAGRQLDAGRDALVVCIWQPFDVGFVPAGALRIDAAQVRDVRKAAEDTAAEGASLAEAAGFTAPSVAVQGAPAWRAIVELADEHDASVIVLGSHGRSGLADVLLGSVAGAVAAHSKRTVLISHRRPAGEDGAN